MYTGTQQLIEDIAYCKEALGCNKKEIDELMNAANDLTLNTQYFVEEFIFGGENVMKYHREDYMDLDVFNEIHGIYFEEVEE